MEALARELGCGYLARPTNEHFKAGNLNHALARTEGELVAVVDADHLLREDFLDRLVGYFEDPRVALVQTPQVFYNLDSFQHHFRPSAGELWHEGVVFHHAMQPGAQRWNAAFFSGTGAVLRRSALDRAGGFATGSVTEDVFTSMRLHAAGYRSVYHDEALGYLLAPDSLQQYLTQRLRWGQGSMQILRLSNPLTLPGLTWRQRFAYFTTLSSFFQAVVHLGYYVTPAVFLLGGPAPLRIDRPEGIALLLAHVTFDLGALRFFLGPLARVKLAECYKFLNVFAYLKALAAVVAPRARIRFRVTTKGRDQGISYRLLLPQLLLVAINLTAMGFGVIRLTQPGLGPMGTLGFLVATGFAGLFVLIGGTTLLFARHRLAARAEFTCSDDISARLRTSRGSEPARVLRAGPGGFHLLAAGAPGVEAGARCTLEMDLEDGLPPLRLDAELAALDQSEDGWLCHVVSRDLTDAESDRLFDRFVGHSIPRMLAAVAWARGVRVPPPGSPAPYYLDVQPKVI
jgi:cellulose synthase (UDP-forming)